MIGNDEQKIKVNKLITSIVFMPIALYSTLKFTMISMIYIPLAYLLQVFRLFVSIFTSHSWKDAKI
jgi:hypothetical protein